MAMEQAPFPIFCTHAAPKAFDSAGTVRVDEAMTAAYSADSYCRSTGQPGFAVTVNLFEALYALSAFPTTWGDRIGVIAVNIVPPDQLAYVQERYKEVTRTCIRVDSEEDLGALPRRIQEALPISVPIQLVVSDQLEPGLVKSALQETKAPPYPRVAPDGLSDLVDSAQGSLNEAVRPLILVGRSAALHTEPALVKELAQRLHCPILLTTNATATPPEVIAGWRAISEDVVLVPATTLVWVEAFVTTDCVLALGSNLAEGEMFGLHDYRFPCGPIILVGLQELGIGNLAGLTIHADPQTFVEAMLKQGQADEPSKKRKKWLAEIGEDNQKQRKYLQSYPRKKIRGQRVDPAYLSRTVHEHAPENTYFMGEGNSSGMWMWTYLWLRPVVHPTLQATIGMMVHWPPGIRHAHPKRPIWALVGDGSFFYQTGVLRTLVKHEIPAVFFVLNNSSWSAIRLEQTFWFKGRYPGTNMPATDFAAIARLEGCDSRQARNADELLQAVEYAKSRPDADKAPLVVEVFTPADNVPISGSLFAMAELDYIAKPMTLSMLISFVLAFFRGQVPLRLLWLAIKLFLF